MASQDVALYRVGEGVHLSTDIENATCLSECLIGRALDGLAVGLILTNSAGKVIWLNRAAREMLRLADDEGIGRPLTQIAQDPQLVAFWQQAAQCGGNVMGALSVRSPEPLELKVNATSCLGRDGEPIGRALLFCDVTKERNIQLELSQAVASRFLEIAGDSEQDGHAAGSLTPQELQVLKLVGSGMSNQEIADRNQVSLSTVRSHLKSTYRKLDLKSRTEAVSYAIRNHLV